MIMSANEDHIVWESLKVKISDLLTAVEQDDYVRIRQLLCETVSGYTPDSEIVDWIHRKQSANPTF
ncbi:hypothetical protein D3C85_1795850 [compost metagenome]